jgi:hypothetical protein
MPSSSFTPQQLESRAEFEQLSYWEQWDCCVAHFARTGNRTALPSIVFHQLCFALHLLLLQHVMRHHSGPLESGTPQYLDCLLKNSCVLFYLSGFLAITGGAGYSGPMYGEAGRLTAHKFKLGVPVFRSPLLLGRLAGRRILGETRTLVDLLHTALTVAVSLQMLREPVPGPALAGTFVGLYLLFQLLELGQAIGNYNMLYNWLVAWICGRYALRELGGAVFPAMQLQLTIVYIGCGLAKLGPWWEAAFGNEWTSPPPFAGRSFLLDLFYRNATGKGGACDFRPTSLSRWASRLTGLIELGAPVLLLASHSTVILPDPAHREACRLVGWLTLTAMHAYIVSHFAHADVNALNLLTCQLLHFCWGPRSLSIEYHGMTAMPTLSASGFPSHPATWLSSPLVRADFLVACALALDGGYALYGHLNTHRAWQSQTYK